MHYYMLVYWNKDFTKYIFVNIFNQKREALRWQKRLTKMEPQRFFEIICLNRKYINDNDIIWT